MNVRKKIMYIMFGSLSVFFLPLHVLAATNQDAHELLLRLRTAGIDKIMPDELKSTSETIITADRYYTSNQRVLAEKYYLLAIQKARIIIASVPGGVPEIPSLSAESNTDKTSEAHSGVDSATTIPPASPSEQPTKVPVASGSTSDVTGQQAGEEAHVVKQDDITSDKIVGSVGIYTVVKGDTMSLVSAKLGVSRDHLAKENKLSSNRAPLKVGQSLRYNNRKIIPKWLKNGIVINVPDRTLYFFQRGKLAISLPVALGVPVVNDKYDWRTPLGKFKITAKVKDPTWYVPPSIQSEMEENGKDVILSIPPGPENPLGQFAMKTSLPGILIHSTIKPASIYGFASHGCIRVYPDKMEELFNTVKVATQGEIIYRPVKLAVIESGKILLEAHKDVYDKTDGIAREARVLIEKHGLASRVDWKKVEKIVNQKTGIAEDISLN